MREDKEVKDILEYLGNISDISDAVRVLVDTGIIPYNTARGISMIQEVARLEKELPKRRAVLTVAARRGVSEGCVDFNLKKYRR